MTELKLVPKHKRALIMGSTTSRCNKLWLVIAWAQLEGYFVEYRWAGREMLSRLQFRWHPDEDFVQAKSFEEDVLRKMDDGRKK